MKELIKDLSQGNVSHAGERVVDFLETDFRAGLLVLLNAVDLIGGETGWSIIKNAVFEEDKTEKTNTEKHDSAKEVITEALKSAGIDVGGSTSILDILIKIAVKLLRSFAA